MNIPPIEMLLRHVVEDVRDAQGRFALVGGVALGARTMPRFTHDVDLALAVTDDGQAESILAYLIRYGYRRRAELNHQRTQRLMTMRLIPPYDIPAIMQNPEDDEGEPIADLIFSTCGIEPEIVAAADPVEVFPDLILPTARVPHLIAMKLVSESETRLQDRMDLLALIRSATADDLRLVPDLLDLITTRGYHQDKDLPARFDHFRQLAAQT